MRDLDALTGREGPEVRQSVPIFLYDDPRFGSFCVAEPDFEPPCILCFLAETSEAQRKISGRR
jgi:hypothetical protein